MDNAWDIFYIFCGTEFTLCDDVFTANELLLLEGLRSTNAPIHASGFRLQGLGFKV